MKFLLLFIISTSTFAFDRLHTKWDKVLKEYTVKEGSQVLVKYKKLKEDRGDLKSYLLDLESLTEKKFKQFNDADKLAFWINAYNAYTVDLIVRNYPVESIKDLGNIFSSTWSKEFIKLFKKKMSLDDIEHETIRKQFKEPRIHFAVNCASIGCPSLVQEAFVGDKIENQLERAALSFIMNKSKNYYDKKKRTLYFSMIFKWYGADFNYKYKGYRNYVSKILKAPKGFEQEWLDYDWSLNDSK